MVIELRFSPYTTFPYNTILMGLSTLREAFKSFYPPSAEIDMYKRS